MRLLKRLTCLVIVSCLSLAAAFSQTIELVNNHDFPLRLPLEIKNFPISKAERLAGDASVQVDGSNLVFIAQVGVKGRKTLVVRQASGEQPTRALTVEPTQVGVRLGYNAQPLGELSWDIIVKDLTNKGKDLDASDGDSHDFDPAFKALPVSFRKTGSGLVFVTWEAQTAKYGLRLALTLRCFHDGFLDISSRLTNESAERTTNVYSAVVCRWDQNAPSARSMCYDNHIGPLASNARSLFREGEGRHLAIQRGVDWIRTTFANGASVAWLNDFAPSFTVPAAATPKTPAHFAGANASLLGREAETRNSRLYTITEIARSSVRSFRDRLRENILPLRGESLSYTSRLVFGDSTLDDIQTDHLFVAWNSLIEQRSRPGWTEINFGTPSVRFGTSYFPYSTLGENFDAQKLPGMDRESFWPLAADTMNEWRLFADDIRRDLRIAKAMGFQLIRLHHLELLAPIKRAVRQEYLDFLFSELRHLQLRALVDIYASPRQITELLSRYGDAIDGIEIENEILIWGIPQDRPPEWNQVYAAVKKTAPHVRVNFTGYNNTGMFDRLSALGVNFDRICLHSYIDSLETIPSGRGYSLALSSYANRSGKSPLITEWNWRGLTRMTPEARAKVYPQIIESAIATRGIPDFYQFQFNETLCPNPRSGRGNILRHYELLHLSRRPKPEALALTRIIRKYSAEDDPVRMLDVSYTPIQLDQEGKGQAALTVTNSGKTTLRLVAAVESGEDLFAELAGQPKIVLRPGDHQAITVRLSDPKRQPGFYYAFLRLQSDNGILRYAWIEARLVGRPTFEASPPKLDWANPIFVVYGQDAPALEVETAIAIAETLESASGQVVEAIGTSDLPAGNRLSQILIGTPESNPLIRQMSQPSSAGQTSPLIITGRGPQAVEAAGMNFILTFWKSAKDSAAGRVGLVAKELPRGGDATKLP